MLSAGRAEDELDSPPSHWAEGCEAWPRAQWSQGCRSHLQPIIERIFPAAGSRTAKPPGLILDAAAHLPLPKHDGEALVFLTSGPSG
jgi:hypothetical protein